MAIRWTSMLLLAVLLATSLAGCGKKPKEVDAPDGDTGFPHTYPTSR